MDHELTLLLSESIGLPPENPALKRLAFYEQTLLNNIIFPFLDEKGWEGEHLTFEGLKRYLRAPAGVLNNPNTAAGLRLLRNTKPEIIVCIRYGRILEQRAIDTATQGVLNLHSGRLPEYRGVMATFRAMMAGDNTLFSTVHWIHDNTIDTGQIISLQGVKRTPQACYLSNVLSLYPRGCVRLLEQLLRWHQDRR